MTSSVQITVAVARAPHAPFTIEEALLEAPRAGEVRVRIVGVGVCHTDLVARDQFIPVPLPAVLGHEGSGIVEAVGDGVTKVAVGDHVVLGFASCGHCLQCQAHLPGYCDSFPPLNFAGARPDGSSGLSIAGEPAAAHFFGQSSFATMALAYERNVVKVSKDVPLALLGPLGCGIQTGAGGVMRALRCPKGSSIVIFGGGPVGLSAVMGAKVRGCDPIILVEPVAARRALALELGATHVIDPMSTDVGAEIRTLRPQGVQFAFETSGREDVVATGLAALAPHGLLGLVGVPPKPESALSVNLATLITLGHRIHGIIEGDSDLDGFIPELIQLYQDGRFPFDRLISTFPLTDINAAIESQARGDCIKAVLLT